MSAMSLCSQDAPANQTAGGLQQFLPLIAILSIAIPCFIDVARADDALEATCHELKQDVGNCACAIDFLRQNVGDKNALILMQGWAIALGRKGDITGALRPYYREHHEQEVLQASTSFLGVRIQFFTLCAPPESDLWDLN